MKWSVTLGALACAFGWPASVAAQSAGAAMHIARGDSLYDALAPREALQEYRAAVLLASDSYEAQWKFAKAQTEVAKLLNDDPEAGRERDSLYAVAREHAEAAIRIDSLGAEGHFQRALALGFLSRTKGGKERLRYAREIYQEGARTLELDPRHDGAHHVLGAWHAEVKRLSGLTKFFAKTFLGGGFLGKASWDSAVAHLERAVELRPEHIYHRLDLAEVYVDLHRWQDAAQQLETIDTLPPVTDALDPKYKREAAALLPEVRKRLGEEQRSGGRLSDGS